MVDKITKYMDSLPAEKRRAIDNLMDRIKRGDLVGINIKKLRGYQNIFRARKGKTRIIFQKLNSHYVLLDVGRRSEKTYRGY